MTISSFITITRPKERGDLFDQCYKAASGFSDEVVVIDGDGTWKKEFNWKIIGEHFQKGYETAKGDWVIHLDTDFIFHENDYDAIRNVLAGLEDYPAASCRECARYCGSMLNRNDCFMLGMNYIKKSF